MAGWVTEDRDWDNMSVKEIEEFLGRLEKMYVKPLSAWKKLQVNLDALETGIFPLDMAIGWMGPDGRMGFRARDIVEIFGEPGKGKSCLVEMLIRQTVKQFGPYSVGCLYSEPPEVERMERMGINLDHVLARVCMDPDIDVKKDMAEEQLETLLKMAEDPNTRLLVIDSLGALITHNQIFESNSMKARDLDDSPVAAIARVFNNFLLQFIRRNKNAVLVIVNHYKEAVNTAMFGVASDLIKTPGGRLKEFLANVRIFVRATKDYDDAEQHSVEKTKSTKGLKNSFELVKNKYSHSRGNRVVRSNLDFATGERNNEEKILEYAAFFGTIKKIMEGKKEKKILVSELTPGVATAGAWTYVGNGEQMQSFNGSAKAVEYLLQNPELYDKLKLQLYPKSRVFFEDSKPDFEALLDGVISDGNSG